MGQLDKSTTELNTLLADVDGNSGTNFRITDGVFQIKNTTDSKYHTAWIETVDGNPTLLIAETGES